MTGAEILWPLGIICLVVALLGKELKAPGIQIPASTGKKVRAAMGVIGLLALICGAVLVFYPNFAQQSVQAAEPPGKTSPATLPHGTSGPGAVTASAVASSPSPVSSSGNPKGAAASVYLADMTPSGDGDSPDVNSWNLLGHTYAHSVGYWCDYDESVNFDLNGKYKYFDATVGVDDSADSRGVSIDFTIYGNPGGGALRKLKEVSAQWGAPSVIKDLNVSGATLMAFSTSLSNEFDSCGGEAVWGNAQLIP